MSCVLTRLLMQPTSFVSETAGFAVLIFLRLVYLA